MGDMIYNIISGISPLAEEFIAKVKINKRLNAFTTILDEVFETKRKVTEGFKKTVQIFLTTIFLNGVMLRLPPSANFRTLFNPHPQGDMNG